MTAPFLRSPLMMSAFVVVADAAPVMMWLSEPDGWRTFFNKRWLDFRGRTLADEIGEGWTSGVHEDDRSACLAAYEAAARTDEPLRVEYRLRRADGEFRHMIDRVAPRLDDQGRIDGLIGSCVDITARVNALAALQESERRFRLLAENARDMIYRYRIHPTFGTEYISPAVTAITGRAPQEFLENPELPAAAMHPDDRELAKHVRGNPAQFPEPIVIRWIHRDGRIIHVEHRNTPIYDNSGRLIALEGIGRDVTERLSVETRLRDSQNQLRQLAAGLEDAREKERTRIARELHDELGQSLTAIKMELARTARALVKQREDPAAIDGLQSIVGGIDVAAETVRRLATSLRPPALDHLGLVAAIELEAAALARRTGLRCRLLGNRRVQNLDPTHATGVFRVLQEALTNAVRHSGASAISVSLNGTSRTFSMKVRDNGRGISDLQRADPNAIGLLGMFERADLIGARLTVSSKPGRGTTVSMVIRAPAAHIPRTRPR